MDWTSLLSPIEFLLTNASLMLESQGLAVLYISVALRLLTLPITVRLAKDGFERSIVLLRLKPKVAKIRERYAKDPAKIMMKTMELYQKNNVKWFTIHNLIAPMLQMPIFVTLYHAVKRMFKEGDTFAWIQDLTKPDFLLCVTTTGLMALAMTLNPSLVEDGRMIAILLPTLFTGLFVFYLSSGLQLYWVASSGVSVIQSVVMRRYAAKRLAETSV